MWYHAHLASIFCTVGHTRSVILCKLCPAYCEPDPDPHRNHFELACDVITLHVHHGFALLLNFSGSKLAIQLETTYNVGEEKHLGSRESKKRYEWSPVLIYAGMSGDVHTVVCGVTVLCVSGHMGATVAFAAGCSCDSAAQASPC